MRLRHQNTEGVKRAYFNTGYWFGFGFFLASLYWVASAFIARGGFYIALAPLGMLLLPAGLALFFAFAASLTARFRTKSVPLHALIFAVIIFSAEWLRGHILSGLPWNLPGYIFMAGAPVSQSASFLGIYGLSFLVLLMTAALGYLLSQNFRWVNLAPLGTVLALFGGLWLWGHNRLSNANIEYHNDVLIRIVALDIEQMQKFDQDAYVGIVSRYLSANVKDLGQQPTHIIWPEGAIPYLTFLTGGGLDDATLQNTITSQLAPGQTLFLGLNRIEDIGDERRYYNSMIGLTKSAEGPLTLSSVYDKTKLVPFGEYFPGNRLIAGLNIPQLTAFTTSFAPGAPATASLYGLPDASQQICFEAIFPGFTSRQAKNGPEPEFILTISNDSWFGRSTGPWQHFNQVSYRAIETGLPIVRVASNGVSGTIDPYGRRINSDNPFEDVVIDVKLPKKRP